MELRIIDRTDGELYIEIGGEGHTFMGILKDELLQTDTVTAVAYDMNPEQSSGQTGPVLSIKTESDVGPLDALAETARDVQRTTDDSTDACRAGIDA